MRLVIRIIGGLLILLVVLAVGLLFVPGERIARIAGDQFQAQTGRTLTFSGKVRFSLFPLLGVKTEAVQLGNAAWSTRGPMLTAKSAAIGVDLMALLGGTVKIRRIEVDAPAVLLEKNADGRVNWQFADSGDASSTNAASAATSEPNGNSAMADITLDRLILTDAAVGYFEAGASVLELNDVDVDLRWPDPSGPASLVVGLVPAADKVRLSAEVGDMQALLAGAVTAVTAKVSAAGGDIGFTGRASMAAELAGELTLQISDSAGFAQAFGITDLVVPKGLGQSMEVSGQLTVTKTQAISLRRAQVSLDHNSLSGDIDVAMAERPHVTARLRAGQLDLSALAGGDAAAGGTASADSGWSKAAIDFSPLALIDGDLVLQVEALNTGDFQLSGIDARVTMDNARAVIDLNALQIFGGKVTGQVIANNRSGFSSRLKVTASALDMNELLSQTAGISRFTGTGDAAINVLASGGSLYDLMNSLDGSLSLKLGAGTITGIDLDALMSGRMGGGTTVFDSITATGQFAKGVLSNDDLVMKLSVIEASGKGQIGVGQRTISYDFVPVAVTSGSETISLPVKIRGSWDDPDISVDLEKALNVDLEDELDKVKDRVENKIKTKIETQLGLTGTDGQSLKDTVKDELEKKAEKGLLKLLGVD